MKLGRILKDYQQAGSLNALISVHAAIDEHVFLTKGGDLLIVLKADGPDPECLDERQLDTAARALENGLRTFDVDFRVQQYFIKRPISELASRPERNPIVNRAIHNRLEYF